MLDTSCYLQCVRSGLCKPNLGGRPRSVNKHVDDYNEMTGSWSVDINEMTGSWSVLRTQ